jgi:hypothetical protein
MSLRAPYKIFTAAINLQLLEWLSWSIFVSSAARIKYMYSAIASRRSSPCKMSHQPDIIITTTTKRKLSYDTHLYRMISTGICSVSVRLTGSLIRGRNHGLASRVSASASAKRRPSHTSRIRSPAPLESHLTRFTGIARQARGSQGPRPVRRRPRPVRARGRVISSLRARAPACRLPRRRLAPRNHSALPPSLASALDSRLQISMRRPVS